MGISKWLFGKIQHNNNGGHHQKNGGHHNQYNQPAQRGVMEKSDMHVQPVERSIQRRAASADNADFH
ncbi:hypothetical protein ACHFCA_28600 [Delftia tsuruhatensis]